MSAFNEIKKLKLFKISYLDLSLGKVSPLSIVKDVQKLLTGDGPNTSKH